MSTPPRGLSADETTVLSRITVCGEYRVAKCNLCYQAACRSLARRKLITWDAKTRTATLIERMEDGKAV